MKFSNLLKLYRERKFYSATDVGRKIDVTGSYITNIENGHRPPPKIPMCEKLADALELSPTEKALFISAAMEERLTQDEIQWVESKTKNPAGTAPTGNISQEIQEALKDHTAVKGLLSIHASPKEIKSSIEHILDILLHMKPEKRKALLQLLNGNEK
jgi:transcriptional regulator with XRE-family HTH domain